MPAKSKPAPEPTCPTRPSVAPSKSLIDMDDDVRPPPDDRFNFQEHMAMMMEREARMMDMFERYLERDAPGPPRQPSPVLSPLTETLRYDRTHPRIRPVTISVPWPKGVDKLNLADVMKHHIFTFSILSYLIGGLVLSTNGLFHHLFRHQSYSFSLPKPYSCRTHVQHMDDIIHADTSWTPYCIHTADTRSTHGRFSIITYMQLPLVFNGFTD
ncbi:hypothetical protein CPB85DRAFT_1442291 [Mucidula mucida]|nr:hypothetical protein CPB85DRAFT_1442291 [Mucidula mucida]